MASKASTTKIHVCGNDEPEAIPPIGWLSAIPVAERDIHAIMASMESELLNLPDYATARFKALLAELKAKL